MRKETGREFVKKYLLLFAAAVVLAAAAAKVLVYQTMLAQAGISSVFRTIPFEESEGTVTLTARVKRGAHIYTNEQLLSAFARRIDLSLTGEPRRVSYTGREELVYEKEAAGACSVIKLVWLAGEQAEYLCAEITLQNASPDAIQKLREDMERAAKKLGMEEISTTLSLTGSLSGQLPLAKKDELADTIMNRLYAALSYEHRENIGYTVYGYSPTEKEYLMVGGRKVNVQAAIYYDEAADRTEVVIATPVGIR